MGHDIAFGWEVSLMTFIQQFLGEKAIMVLSRLSVFGEEVFIVLIIGLLYWGIDKKFGRTVGMIVLLNNVWTTMIKNVVLRRRPYFDHESIKIYRPVKAGADIYDVQAQGFSFPSGHSANSVAAYGGVAAGIEKSEIGQETTPKVKSFLKGFCIVMPVLIGISRVIVGAHYPTDVLAGWLLGCLCIFLVPLLEKKLGRTLFSVTVALVSCLGIFYCQSEDYFSSLGLLIGFLLSIPFEERFVRFESTRSIVRILLRLAGGGIVYVALNTLLKLPFSSEFLDNGSLAAHLVRTGRYLIISFCAFALYPWIFALTKRIRPFAKD